MIQAKKKNIWRIA